jgi:hypothetical protein
MDYIVLSILHIYFILVFIKKQKKYNSNTSDKEIGIFNLGSTEQTTPTNTSQTQRFLFLHIAFLTCCTINNNKLHLISLNTLATTGLGCGLSVASTKLMKPKRQKLLI